MFLEFRLKQKDQQIDCFSIKRISYCLHLCSFGFVALIFFDNLSSLYAENLKAKVGELNNSTKNITSSEGLFRLSSNLEELEIIEIQIEVRDIFNEGDSGFYDVINHIKTSTKQHIVERELLFKKGDRINSLKIEESLRNLRSIKFLRDPKISVQPTKQVGKVKVIVSVQDTWTLMPQVSMSSGSGNNNQSFGLQESNLYGLGKRLEVLSKNENDQSSIEAVYDDRRLLGGSEHLLLSGFNREDGEEYNVLLDRPFRTFLDKNSWEVKANTHDLLGRLYEAGEEDYIYRTKATELGAKYTYAKGNPEILARRYSFGALYNEDTFSNATAEDIANLNLDSPEELDQNSARLADARKYLGPLFEYQFIERKFLPKNYIDRFDRSEDYNLGKQFYYKMQYSPSFSGFGQSQDTMLLALNYREGFKISDRSFWRYNLAANSRYGTKDSFRDTIFQGQLSYINTLGKIKYNNFSLGNHTLVGNLGSEFGEDLDRDYQLTAGADNATRGYRARMFTGDKKIVLNLEDRIHLVEDVFHFVSLGSAFFFDVAGAAYESYEDLMRDGMYPSVGMGLRLVFPRSSGSRVLRADIAFPMRSMSDKEDAWSPRFIIAGGQLFDSFFPGERPGSDNTTINFGF